MNKSLMCEFEEVLNDEAKRVVNKMIEMYENKIEVNMDYGDIVRELLDKKYEYYSCEIELRSFKFIPPNLELDQKNVYALISSEEATKRHLCRYVDWCKNDVGDKDHYKAASGIAKNLIEYGKNHKKTTKSFGELVASFMPDYFPTHHDSVDSRTVIMLLEDEFSKGGYEVSSLNPFRISQC